MRQRIIKRAMRLAKKPCPECGDVWREITFQTDSLGRERKIATVCYVNHHQVDRKHSVLADSQLSLRWEAEGCAA